MEIVEIGSPNGTARIATKGAHVMDVRLDGRDLLWLSTAAEKQAVTPGVAVRGGVPVCFPWFGKWHGDGPAGLPQHGFARTSDWRVAERSADRAVFTLDDDDATRALWPHRFHAELEVTVGDGLDFAFRVTNTDETPFTFTYALHSYFTADLSAPIPVDGLDGRARTDNADGGTGVQDGPLVVDGYLDASFQQAPDELVIRAGDHVVTVDARDMSSAVVWNPGPNTMPDVGDQWPEFVCVERGRVGTAAVSLAPGDRYTGSLALRRRP